MTAKLRQPGQDGEAGFRRQSRDQDETLKPGSGEAGIASSIRRGIYAKNQYYTSKTLL